MNNKVELSYRMAFEVKKNPTSRIFYISNTKKCRNIAALVYFSQLSFKYPTLNTKQMMKKIFCEN